MPQWTQGDWGRNIKPATKYNTIYAGRNTHVCHLAGGLSTEETEANCNLIVAAPKMFETLERVLRDKERGVLTIDTCELIEGVLKKARGE